MRQSARGPHTVEFTQWPVARFCFGYVRPAHRCEVTDGFSFSIVSVLMIDASQTTGGSERVSIIADTRVDVRPVLFVSRESRTALAPIIQHPCAKP